MSSKSCNTAILISGSGTNLQSFIDHVASDKLEISLAIVFANRANAYGLTRARDAGIATACIEHGDFDDRLSFDRAVAKMLDKAVPRLLLLAGYMRILSPWFVNHYAGRILNIHPALLPAFPGLDTHRRVLDADVTWHGSTVHFVTDELDAGPRILQGRLAVEPGESADELATRVQSIEHQIYPQAANWFANGRLVYRDGAAWLDGKRLDEPIVMDFN
ncbi:MAG: phosphoribosylglycinamide formyltransferase [Proteobacteria bacterium]|nr:phosphoribosylglycinamide formyltransferase [Pseudomonadota bacterium]